MSVNDLSFHQLLVLAILKNGGVIVKSRKTGYQLYDSGGSLAAEIPIVKTPTVFAIKDQLVKVFLVRRYYSEAALTHRSTEIPRKIGAYCVKERTCGYGLKSEQIKLFCVRDRWRVI